MSAGERDIFIKLIKLYSRAKTKRAKIIQSVYVRMFFVVVLFSALSTFFLLFFSVGGSLKLIFVLRLCFARFPFKLNSCNFCTPCFQNYSLKMKN